MMDAFLATKWKEVARREQGLVTETNLWSWLEADGDIQKLWHTEWNMEFEHMLRNTFNFNDQDIARTRWRMAMGGLRYGSMASGNYKKLSSEYYLDRLGQAGTDAFLNKEGLYDYANIYRLFVESGQANIADMEQGYALLELLSGLETEYHPTDRKE